MGRNLRDRMTWIFNDTSFGGLSLAKATCAGERQHTSETALGPWRQQISPNKCAWRPTFAGSPFPARKFPSERCHLFPPSACFYFGLSPLLLNNIAKINFPPFLQERCVMVVCIHTVYNARFLVQAKLQKDSLGYLIDS